MKPGLLLCFATGAMLVSVFASRSAPRAWLVANLVGLGAALTAALVVLMGGTVVDWTSAFAPGGTAAHVRCDAISAFFLVLLAVVGGAATVYAREYWPEAAHPRSARAGRFWWSVLLLSLLGVLLMANGLHFLVVWELFTLAAYFLITLDRRRAEVRAAGWLYLGASHVGTLALFAFFGGVAAVTGSWDLGPQQSRAELAPLFWLALLGFGIKSGAFPLHVWLPSGHANAPSHVSAILSGVTIKMGVYGLVRCSAWMPVPLAAGWTIVALGLASAVLGVAFALGQHDLKRLLAYHSVENIGIILIGLGFGLLAIHHGHPAWGALALAGGLLHVWNHGLFKALLFFGAGSVLHVTGTREMSRLGGLWRGMPWTAGLFALGAAAICGLPPLNGFVSEWLIYLGLFDAALDRGAVAWAALPAAILLGITGALALACFVKVCGVVFLGAPRSRAAEQARETGPLMRGAMLALAAACLIIGLAPALIWPAVARTVAAWTGEMAAPVAPAPLVLLGWAHVGVAVLALAAVAWLYRRSSRRGCVRAPTWDCGFAVPTVRMQYTAGSFAGIITEWFAWILHPHRHEQRPESVLPASARQEEHTPETLLDHVITPVAGVVMRLSAAVRRLQHGRLQTYLIYLVLGLVTLGLVVVIGGRS